jgi:hypothetical protein
MSEVWQYVDAEVWQLQAAGMVLGWAAEGKSAKAPVSDLPEHVLGAERAVRAYPNIPAARKATSAQAKCNRAM